MVKPCQHSVSCVFSFPSSPCSSRASSLSHNRQSLARPMRCMRWRWRPLNPTLETLTLCALQSSACKRPTEHGRVHPSRGGSRHSPRSPVGWREHQRRTILSAIDGMNDDFRNRVSDSEVQTPSSSLRWHDARLGEPTNGIVASTATACWIRNMASATVKTTMLQTSRSQEFDHVVWRRLHQHFRGA